MDHRPPEWIEIPTYFITICARLRDRNQLCTTPVAPEILASIGIYNDRHRWYCDDAVLMPDHVHLLVSFPPDLALFSSVIGDWKRWITRRMESNGRRTFLSTV
jgi:REP element-mobilizing transposase RayT